MRRALPRRHKEQTAEESEEEGYIRPLSLSAPTHTKNHLEDEACLDALLLVCIGICVCGWMGERMHVLWRVGVEVEEWVAGTRVGDGASVWLASVHGNHLGIFRSGLVWRTGSPSASAQRQ